MFDIQPDINSWSWKMHAKIFVSQIDDLSQEFYQWIVFLFCIHLIYLSKVGGIRIFETLKMPGSTIFQLIKPQDKKDF